MYVYALRGELEVTEELIIRYRNISIQIKTKEKYEKYCEAAWGSPTASVLLRRNQNHQQI